MMDCQKIELLLMEYAAGELDAVICADIELHLENCRPCCQELEREKILAETLGGLPVGKSASPAAFAYPLQTTH